MGSFDYCIDQKQVLCSLFCIAYDLTVSNSLHCIEDFCNSENFNQLRPTGD